MSCRYIGSELELFAAATNWKTYPAAVLGGFIAGRVLEVGAGIGANLAYLCNPRVDDWTSLEPDPDLASQIGERVRGDNFPSTCRVVTGTLGNIDRTARFDTILYLDVLEHIAEDRAELALAREHLTARGNLVVLAPAHQYLFSRFRCRDRPPPALRSREPAGADPASMPARSLADARLRRVFRLARQPRPAGYGDAVETANRGVGQSAGTGVPAPRSSDRP